MLWNNPSALYATLGSSFRFIQMQAIDFFYPAFMLMAYPQHKSKYLVLQALSIATTGLISAVSGGVMADRWGKSSYAKICLWGSALAWPCCVIGLLTTNFNLAIVMLFCRFLLGENHWAPNLSMIQQSCKPKEVGTFISAYQFCNIVAGCISTVVTGTLVNYFGVANSAAGLGKLLAAVSSVGYAGGIYWWWKAGRLFKERENLQAYA